MKKVYLFTNGNNNNINNNNSSKRDMTAPATRQTARAGLETAAAPIFVIGDHEGAAAEERALETRRRRTADGNETRNPTRAVTHAGMTRGLTRGTTKGVGGGGGAGLKMTPAEAATMARVEEMKAKKDEDVKELYLAEESLEETPVVMEK